MLKNFSCKECDFKDPCRANLKEHMRNHLGEKLQKDSHDGENNDNIICNVCKKCFETITELNNHLYTHKILNLYLCTECEYQDSSEDKLKIHMRIHNSQNNENLVCSVCKECFESIPELNNHMHTHNIFNLFSCTECVYQHPSKERLKEHMITHFREK